MFPVGVKLAFGFFVLALLARFFVLWRAADEADFLPESGDMHFYSEWARRIAAGSVDRRPRLLRAAGLRLPAGGGVSALRGAAVFHAGASSRGGRWDCSRNLLSGRGGVRSDHRTPRDTGDRRSGGPGLDLLHTGPNVQQHPHADRAARPGVLGNRVVVPAPTCLRGDSTPSRLRRSRDRHRRWWRWGWRTSCSSSRWRSPPSSYLDQAPQSVSPGGGRWRRRRCCWPGCW